MTARFQIDGSSRGKLIGNRVSTINLWQFQTWPTPVDEGANLSDFVETVQFMTATGGNASRDLFKDPTDFDTLDDYAFEPLLDKCQAVLDLGAKPFLKLSVPDKFSREGKVEVFGVDAYPPDDYEVYYAYILAMGKALVERFGREEVLSWGFGVLVEFENADWFHDKERTPEGSREAYFKLYDYSVAALEEALGSEVWIGAHAMACTEGLWDERDLLNHCVYDKNAKTGKVGTTIKYFAVSFYDDLPHRPHPMSLAETVARIRERAAEVGLKDLHYGVDEGRILGASKGRYKNDLTHRTVGQTYQCAYDARIFKILIDNDIDYFSMWSYSSSSPWSGYPLLYYRVAQELVKFKSSKLLTTTASCELAEGVDCSCVAGFDEESQRLHVMAYNFKYDLNYQGVVDATFALNLPMWQGKRVKVVRTEIDDRDNFFLDWLKDKEELGIPDDAFSWSPDSGCLDVGFINPEITTLYREKLRDKYKEKANRAPRTESEIMTVGDDGALTLSARMERHGTVFYQVEEAKD
ncbi:MAG: hypothetical protein Q4G03_00195 [Planctomycetia bacterium]|nr:hypothetical protein [Planctomycetia bacterium]